MVPHLLVNRVSELNLIHFCGSYSYLSRIIILYELQHDFKSVRNSETQLLFPIYQTSSEWMFIFSSVYVYDKSV